MKFIVTGGANHIGKGLFLKKVKGGYGHICELDWNKKKIERQFNYYSPENIINPHITKELTCGNIYENELYVSSRTEVIILDLEKFNIKKKITNQTFNDLHHAIRIDKQIYIANTGLEMVQRFSLEGEELEQINLSDIPTWERFDKKIDYRLVESTKPHKIHVNYIFVRNKGEIWATCLIPKEVVCINNERQKIKIIEGHIHDGHVTKDCIYFTTTKGLLIVFERKSLKKLRMYNILSQYEKKKGGQLGWCRGVCIVDDRAYVGFTSIRPTKNLEYIDRLTNKKNSLSSRIVEVDLHSGEIMDEYIFPYKNCTVYSIIELC